MPIVLPTSLPSLAMPAACLCWILDVTIVELIGEMALLVSLDEQAGLGPSLVLPIAYFPFLEATLTQSEPACGWVADGSGITSAIVWPALGERRTINQLHAAYFEHQLFTLFQN